MVEEGSLSIEALRAGDRAAFAAMVEACSPKIYRLALRMMGDAGEAEDILQETFLNAFRALAEFEGRSQPCTWLYRIATNQALMRLRRKTPERTAVELDTDPESAPTPRELTDWCCLPEDEFMSSEAQAQLDQAVSQLSPALRATFILRDLQEFSTRETADILGISEAAVKTRLLRARLQLRELLSQYFAERVRKLGIDG